MFVCRKQCFYAEDNVCMQKTMFEMKSNLQSIRVFIKKEIPNMK